MEPNQTPQQEVKVNNPLNVMGDGEVNLFELRRHPIGLVIMYASYGLLLLLVAIVAVMAPTWLSDYDTNTVRTISLAAFLFSFAFSAIFAFIGHVVYNGNRWILTSDSLTQITQRSLFDRQSSQLSLANLEDITAHQNGIVPHLFNYGVLKAETAGEHSKFTFVYCPNPNKYAQQILQAREAFEQGGGHVGIAQSQGGINVNTQ